MRKKTLKFIEKNELAQDSDKILVACSGGADSVALGHLLQSLGFTIGLAHVNYGFRGIESELDARFVEQLAQHWGIPFHILTPEEHRLVKGLPGNLQAKAREVRYKWFGYLANRFGYTRVATAHHWDDRLETMLLHLFRGTGIRGLPGLTPLSQHPDSVPIIRPILFAPKEDILCYLDNHGLTYREDESNKSPIYRRNRLRHEVLPILKDIFPDIIPSTKATFWHLERQGRLYERYLTKWMHQIGVGEGKKKWTFKRSTIEEMNTSEWIELLLAYRFTYRQILDMCPPRALKPGQKYSSSEYSLLVDREVIIIKSNSAPSPEPVILSKPGHYPSYWGELYISEVHLDKVQANTDMEDPNVFYIEATVLSFPLLLRPRAPGDRFFPRGMGGKSKTVKKYLTDIKYPMEQKATAPVVCNGNGDILWLPGLRKDERYSISNSTRSHFYLFKWTKKT